MQARFVNTKKLLSLCAAIVLVLQLIASDDLSAQVMRSKSTKVSPAKKSTLRWPKPAQLKSELSPFGNNHLTADWATRTSQLVDYLCTQTEVAQQEAIEVLVALKGQSAEVPSLIEQIKQSASSQASNNPDVGAMIAELQRFQYRLDRRVEMWAGVIDHARSQSNVGQSPVKTVSLNRLPRELDFLESGWQEYLAWDPLVRAANVSNQDKNAQKALKLAAQKFLARYHSPALTDDQRQKFQPMFSPLVLDSIRSVASGETDHYRAMALIEVLENYKEPGKHLHYLNAEYQNLLWSDSSVGQGLAAVLDSHWRNANIRVAINERLLNQLLPQMPATTEPVSERVQGAKVSGQNLIENQLRIGLIPNPNEISLAIESTGQVTTDTIAKKSGFIFQNRGLADFRVLQTLAFSRTGVTSEEPSATSSAKQRLIDMKGSYDRVPLIGRLTRMIAKKQAEELTPEAEQLTRNKVEAGAKERIEQEVNELVYEFRRGLHENVLARLISMDLEPETVQLSTSEQRIVGRYRIAGRDQMAAWQPRPIDSEDDLLTVQFHQSAINNLIDRLSLSGREFNPATLGKHIELVAGIPYKRSDEDAAAKFEFKKFDPVRVDFNDGIVSLTFNFRQFQIGKGKTWRNLSVTAKYTPSYIGTRIVLDKSGPEEIKLKCSRADEFAVRAAFRRILERQYAFDLLPQTVRKKMPHLAFAIENLSLAEGWCGVVFDNASDVNRNVPIVTPENVVPGTWSDQLGAFQPQKSKVLSPRTARRIGTDGLQRTSLR